MSLLWIAAASAAETRSYCFRVYLKDKGVPAVMTETPEAFLSEEAIARRTKRGVDITPSDVPIAASYLEALARTGGRVVAQSKWMATVVVESEDSLLIDRLHAWPIVDSACCVWLGTGRAEVVACTDQSPLPNEPDTKIQEPYGYATKQIELLNGIRLHDAGRRGQGMRVAVIDEGFRNVNRISAFSALRLLGTHNVIVNGNDVFCKDDHGTKVLSCMAACLPGVMVGTAPEASYLLIKSEDSRAEYPIEEDYWAAALEYADSVGVDVIVSSLGYSVFNLQDTIYTPADLDGQTAFISRVAGKASEKGLLLFCSAGNEGSHPWGKITFPADASGVIAIGAINADKTRCSFSSTGFTADYRIKPDMVALGANVCVVGPEGAVEYMSGTSFSTPTVAGLSVCLWQALPWLNAKEITALLLQTASQSQRPDVERGYGIPDLFKAYQKELHGPVQ
jgi:subtilisin family serine protease